MIDEDLFDLIAACKGEEIDPSRRDQLLARLRGDEAFQDAFVAEIRLLGMLKAVQSTEPRWLRLHDELGWLSGKLAAAEQEEEAFMRRLRGLPTRHAPGGWRWWAASAAAALLAGAAVLAWSWGRREAWVGPGAWAGAPAVADYARGLAMVIKLDGVVWESGDGPHPAPGSVLPAGRIAFRSGRATLSFLNGVVLVAEGPADLDLVSMGRVFCRRGRLRARVPDGAEGFVVSSPRSAVMDLGTEFEIDVTRDGKSQVLVHEGQTEGAVLSESGIPRRSQRMTSQQAFEIDPRAGRIDAVAGPKNVVGPADLVAPALELDPSYPAAILASRPWSYWRFGSLAGGVVPNEIPGRPPLRAVGPIGLTDAAAGAGANRSALFLAGETGQYLAMEGTWEPARGPGYAMELWFLSEVFSHATLAILYVPTDEDQIRHFKHMFFAELTASTRHTMHPPGAVRFLHRWPPGSEGGDNFYSETRYVPFRWHHLVLQLDGDAMELFLDGVSNEPLPVTREERSTACRLLLGRLTTAPLHSFYTSRPFVGRLDEVALYDRPLAPEEVRRHHRLASRSARPD